MARRPSMPSDVPSAPAGGYRITAAREGIYCAGLVHTVSPREIPADWLTPAQVEDLQAHPDLTIEILEASGVRHD